MLFDAMPVFRRLVLLTGLRPRLRCAANQIETLGDAGRRWSELNGGAALPGIRANHFVVANGEFGNKR
jgi:hypothetical protein